MLAPRSTLINLQVWFLQLKLLESVMFDDDEDDDDDDDEEEEEDDNDDDEDQDV